MFPEAGRIPQLSWRCTLRRQIGTARSPRATANPTGFGGFAMTFPTRPWVLPSRHLEAGVARQTRRGARQRGGGCMKRLGRLIGVLTACALLITLAACQCTYTVAPASAPAVAAGVTIPVTVTTSASTCGWQYQSNDPWLTVGPDPDNTGQTGQGNGRVLITVA